MPRCFSISIQSEVAWREALRALTEPAIWIAPENSSSFSVSVVLPASGWEMIAKVRRRRVSAAKDMAVNAGRAHGRGRQGKGRDFTRHTTLRAPAKRPPHQGVRRPWRTVRAQSIRSMCIWPLLRLVRAPTTAKILPLPMAK